jgi:hypothetical protein
MPEVTVQEQEHERLGEGGGPGGGATDPRVAFRDPPADADDLIAFVRALKVVVQACLERPALFAPYGPLLRRTWPMLEADFDSIVSDLQSATSDDLERLAQHGLVGSELEFKLKVFYGASGDFLRRLRDHDNRTLRNTIFGHPARRIPLGASWETAKREGVAGFRKLRTVAKKRLKGVAGLALKAADAVLGSIGVAIPVAAIAAAALGETKGIMEAIADSDLSEDSEVPATFELPADVLEELLAR